MLFMAAEKVRDGWVKDEREIDGYREKKMRRNSRRETERWTEKQTDSKGSDRVRVRDREGGKSGRELKKPQQKHKAHEVPLSL